MLGEGGQECGLYLPGVLGLQAGPEEFSLHELWLLFCGEFHYLMGEKGGSIVSAFISLVASDGENNGNICTEPQGTSLSYFETTGMELSTANVTNSRGFQGWEVSQVEAGPLCESSSQGNLESAPVTLCPAQALLRPGQWP